LVLSKHDEAREKYLSIAKIARPLVKGTLPRKRLFRKLQDCREKPIVWVSGPPGCGKTTLVASYVEAYKIPCIWYQLDEGDSDISTFFSYMGLAAKKAAPRERKALPLLTSEYLNGVPTFTLRYFEELFRRFPSPFIMVFDNYQRIPAASGLHEIISGGLSVIPEKVNVIVMSRGDPPPKLARFCAGNSMSFLVWDDLRFTLSEYKKIISSRNQKGFNDSVLRELHRKTDGWAAGLVLMLEMARIRKIDSRLLDTLTPEEIFDYFISEIYEKTDKEEQDFLLRTAFLPRMTAWMAEQLTGNPGSVRLLNVLSHNHYFTEKNAGPEPSYHYHPMFREFLLSSAAITFSPEEVNRIRLKAAELAEESHQIEDAAELLIEAGSWDGFSRLLSKHGQLLIAQGRYKTIEAWMDRVPHPVASERPWLLYWSGTCWQPFDPDRSRRYFEDAFRIFLREKDAAGMFMAWSGVVESIMYGYEGLRPLDQWFSVLDSLMRKQKKFPSDEIEAQITCSMMRALALARPSHVDREKWMGRALDIAGKSKNIPLKINILANIACYRYSGVELQELKFLFDTLRGLLKNQELPPVSRLIVSWVEAAYCNISSLYAECLKVVSDGLDLAAASGIHLMDYMLMGQGVLSSLKTKDLGTAREYLRKMSYSLSTAKPWEASFYHYVSAWEALYRDNLSLASFHSDHGIKLCTDVGNPWTLAMSYLQGAVIAHASGDKRKAGSYLENSRAIGLRCKNDYVLFVCILTDSFFAFQKGDNEKAKKLLRQGMMLGQKKGFVNLYMWKPGVMEILLEKALEEGIEVPFVKELIQRNHLVRESSSGAEEWPHPVKVYTLGTFKVLLHEQPLGTTSKTQRRPLDMLKMLIALGGNEIREEQLTDLLWPEADGAAAHTAFTTTLLRLRRLVCNEKAVSLHEGKVRLNPEYVWVDAFAFKEYIFRAEEVMNTCRNSRNADDFREVIRLTDRAMKIYGGHFLCDETEEPWSASLRERLKSKFVRFLITTGNYFEQTGNRKKAVEYYLKGLDTDDLIEEFYQRLMICYLKLGRRSEAAAIYRRCSKTLMAVPGIEPSPETEKIYRTCVLKSE
jgi:LuxR family transcriptional regulator, maltose regulon positive regulatory protein